MAIGKYIFTFSRINNFKVIAVISLSILVILSASLYQSSTSAASIAFHSVRDCDSSAIIDCGALSAEQVGHSYHDDQTIQKIYAVFGITSTSISQLNSKAVAGKVDSKGNVYIDTRTSPVASNTISASRRPVVASTKKITTQGATYYQTNASSVVNGSYSDAFVVMKNKQFDFAIIANNGDPVMRKATIPQPVKPKPAVQPQTAATAIQTPALANTGPTTDNTLTIFITAAAIGSILSYSYRIHKLRQ